MDTLLHIALAVAALAVPLYFAYVVVHRLGRRAAPRSTAASEQDPMH